MDLLGIGCKGVLAFERPLWLDTSTLDGLVAVTGPNGAGKTTVMEIPHGTLHRAFPSRGVPTDTGGYKDKPAYEFALTRDAYTEIVFALDRQAYRALQRLDPVARKTDATIEPLGPNGERLAPLNDGKVSTYDRVIAELLPSSRVTFASIFSVQTRRGSFATSSKREREDLFADFLALSRYEHWAETCRRAVVLLDRARATVTGRRAAIAATCTDAIAQAIAATRTALHQRETEMLRSRTQAEVQLAALEDRFATLSAQARAATAAAQRQQAAQRDLDGAQAEIIRLRAIADTAAAITSAIDDVGREQLAAVEWLAWRETHVADHTARHAQHVAALEQAQAAVRARDDAMAHIARLETEIDGIARDLRARLGDIRTETDTARTRLQAQIAKNRDLLLHADAIKAAHAAATAAEEALTQLRAALETQRGTIETHRQQQVTIDRRLARLAHVDAEIARDARDSATLGLVPCPSTQTPFSGCAFLAAAAQAQQRLQALRAERDTLADAPQQDAAARAVHADLTRVLATITAEIAETEQHLQQQRKASEHVVHLAQVEERIRGYEHALTELATTAAAQEATARERASTATAERETALAALREDLTVLQARVDAADKAVATLADAPEALAAAQRDVSEARVALARLDTRLTDLTNRLGELPADHDVRLVALTATLPALHETVTTAAADVAACGPVVGPLAEVEQALPAAREALTRAREALATIAAELVGVQAREQALADARGRVARTRAALTELDDARVDWQLLADCFGRNGLPKLEMDAAGPQVAEIANDLMHASYGGRFTIDLVTQVATADGRGTKEAFTLHAIDNELGGQVREITDLSGGQQIIVDECLKAAIAVYAARRSSVPMRTCWRDETTGPLDAENADRYVLMLRRLLVLGGFRVIYFVSHLPQIQAQADHQIQVHDGTAEIVHAPFSRQEAA